MGTFNRAFHSGYLGQTVMLTMNVDDPSFTDETKLYKIGERASTLDGELCTWYVTSVEEIGVPPTVLGTPTAYYKTNPLELPVMGPRLLISEIKIQQAMVAMSLEAAKFGLARAELAMLTEQPSGGSLRDRATTFRSVVRTLTEQMDEKEAIMKILSSGQYIGGVAPPSYTAAMAQRSSSTAPDSTQRL